MADIINRNPDQPLGDLDKNKYTYSNFIYPMDLGAPEAGKNHYMVFHINETKNTTFFTQAVNTEQGGKPNEANDPTKGANNQPAIIANSLSDQKDLEAADKDSQNGGSSEQQGFQNYNRNIQRVATTIVLYMPPEVTTNYKADWSQTELGLAADVVNLVQNNESFKDLLGSGVASVAKNAGDSVNTFTGLNLKDAISLSKRMVINNHLEVIFQGIGFREFNFSFRFTPESEYEAINVDNIIRAFKFYSAPEIYPGFSGRFWIYPAEFDIQYYADGKENEFLNKISTCALTNMSVNYTATGHWAAHRSHKDLQGTPSVCTDIRLTFMELELMTKKRILEGY